MSGSAAAFLDRDGTIMRDASYVGDPRLVELLPGAADAVRRLNDHGIPVIVVTNQSGIARGWLTTDDYEAVRGRLDALLAACGARIDRTYMCPHHPDFTGACDCRKPGLLLYRQAIADFDIDATRSVFIGDRLRDVEPAIKLGGRGILLDVESTPPADLAAAYAHSLETAHALATAVDIFLAPLPGVP